jgi:hypothetical protein
MLWEVNLSLPQLSDAQRHCRMTPFSRSTHYLPFSKVSGIQWIPIEATSVLPVGAQPAGTVSESFKRTRFGQLTPRWQDFAESWNRGRGLTEEDKKNIEKW